MVSYVDRKSVKENDIFGDGLSTDGALDDLVSTQLTGAMATQEDTVLSPVHAHLTLSLGGGREGGREGGTEHSQLVCYCQSSSE